MVGLSGMFGVICLCLWFWQTQMLKTMLAEQFHIYVLLSGLALVIVAFTRGIILWNQSRDPAFRPTHDHDHDHGHTHDHSQASHEHEHEHATAVKDANLHAGMTTSLPMAPACGHEHAPGESCGHDHAHGHAHSHGHAHHDHDAADHDHGWAPWRYVVILVPIILFLLGLPDEPPKIRGFEMAQIALDYKQLVLDFTSIIYEALPFIVLGVLLAGLLEEFVPQQAIAKVVPRNHVLAILIGGLLGLIFPMCECGIIVVMKRLLRKGLPLGVCVAYMLAGPVINVVVITSTYVAFSGYNEPGRNDVLGGTLWVVGLRVGMAYVVACVTAVIVHWQAQGRESALLHPSVLKGLQGSNSSEDNGIAHRVWSERINNITKTALNDFVDIMAFLVLGAMLAAGGKFVIKATDIQESIQHTPAIAILVMMGVAVLFCLCSEADAFVAANFPLFWPDSSKLAFLVLGPMLDLKLLLMFTRVFRAKLIITIVISLVIQVFAYSMAAHYLVGRIHPIESHKGSLESDSKHLVSAKSDIYLAAIMLAGDHWNELGFLGVGLRPSGKGEPIDFKQLEALALRPDQREQWGGKLVTVRGQFMPFSANPHQFMLVRQKINCCASDVVQLNVPMLSREPVTGFRDTEWVKVTGKVEFRERGNGAFLTILTVWNSEDIESCPPDPNIYLK